MGRNTSYDDIVRRTVPEPDSSFRPTPQQVAEAGEESRAKRLQAQMTDEERAVYARITQALGPLTHLGDVAFELDGKRVTLHGTVHHVGAIAELERAVSAVGGIEDVENRLVVAARE